MRMVHEVSKLIGVSKRTLQYYDEIGLLSPTEYTESGYRLYDDVALEKLWRILLLKELGYQLNDIKKIMDDPTFDLRESIGKHIKILTKKKERLENLIGYANAIKFTGIIPFNFEAYGDITFDEFIKNSKKTWNMNMLGEKVEGINNPLDYEFVKMLPGLVEQYLNQSGEEWNEDEIDTIAENICSVVDCDKVLAFQECIDKFTNLVGKDVNSKEVHEHVKKLYDYINNHFGCSMSLNGFSMYGEMFTLGGDISMIHTKRLGEETTDFITKAFRVYCDKFVAEQK
jgi:DNA-binding transcriptional MerR regulator